MKSFVRKLLYVLRLRYFNQLLSNARKIWYRIAGMQVGRKTFVPKIYVTWPHQVKLGSNCLLEKGISFKFDGVMKPGPSIIIGDKAFIGAGCEFNIRAGINIGNDVLIASGCRFIDHDHGTQYGELMRRQHGIEQPINIGNDVWLGCNVVVLKGININEGAVVAAGAVVTKSIPAGEIWGGVPAKKIGERKR